jgi:signal transduction histidine kinase
LLADANAGQPSIQIRWVRFDAPPDHPDAPTVPRRRLAAVEAGDIGSFAVEAGERERLYTYVPVALPEHPGAVELSESFSLVHSLERAAMIQQAVLFTSTGLVCLLLVLVLGRRLVGHPLEQLVAKTRRVGAGDFGGPVVLPGRDEFTELASSLNEMCEQLSAARERVEKETAARIRALEELRHADRLKSVGKLAAGVAHELGTPLNVVSARAGLIAAGRVKGPEVQESARIIKEQTRRMTDIIRQILDFARKRPSEKTPSDVVELVAETVDLLAPDARKRGLDLRLLNAPSTVEADLDRQQIRQVLMNLVMNAIQATPEGGKIEVGVGREKREPPTGQSGKGGDVVRIWVRDTGSGIPEDHINRVFEPFFTTKDVGAGTGLGLSVALGIVTEHDGWLEVESEVNEGSCFSVYLPSLGDA